MGSPPPRRGLRQAWAMTSVGSATPPNFARMRKVNHKAVTRPGETLMLHRPSLVIPQEVIDDLLHVRSLQPAGKLLLHVFGVVRQFRQTWVIEDARHRLDFLSQPPCDPGVDRGVGFEHVNPR